MIGKKLESNSQAAQDRFAHDIIGDLGTFLDIGSGHPIEISNSYALEKLGWKGLCVDEGDVEELYKQHRKSKFVRTDSTKCDFGKLITENFESPNIDYLSLDVDQATLPTLHNLLKSKARFKVITVEHDRYRFGQETADKMRLLFENAGYTLVCKDVCSHGIPYEDWWVDISKVDWGRVGTVVCCGKEGTEIKMRDASALDRYFDHIFVINLDRRADRWDHARSELEKLNIKAERFNGYDKPIYDTVPNGNMGCTASHRALLEVIAYHRWRRVLVFEDDFVSLFDDVNEKFEAMIGEVPENWDLLYLGGHYAEPPISRVSPHVIRCGRMMTTSSYGITWQQARRMAPYISGIGPIDSLFSGFAPDNNFYIFQPRLFAQWTSHSDLCDHTRDNVPCMTDTRHENMV